MGDAPTIPVSPPVPRGYTRRLMLFLLACLAPADSDDTADSPVDTADSPVDTADSVDPCATAECCVEPIDRVQACEGYPGFGAGETAGHFTTAVSDGAATVWTFEADDGTIDELSVYGEGEAVAFLDDLDALGDVLVSSTGGCDWDGEAAQGGAFWILDPAGAPIVVVGTGLVDDHGLRVEWDTTATVCLPRPSDGCTDEVQNVPFAATVDGATVSVWQGSEAALGEGRFRVAYGQQPVGESHCDDATGVGMNWVYGR